MNPYDYYITPEEYAVAEANGISRQTLTARIRIFGWEKERAITEKVRQKQPRTHWRKIAEKNGINSGTFYARVHRYGWDVEKAAVTPPLDSQAIAAAARVKIPQTIKDTAKKNGISHSTLMSRIYKSGWDLERAANEPVWARDKISVYGNQRFREVHGHTPVAMFYTRT